MTGEEFLFFITIIFYVSFDINKQSINKKLKFQNKTKKKRARTHFIWLGMYDAMRLMIKVTSLFSKLVLISVYEVLVSKQ